MSNDVTEFMEFVKAAGETSDKFQTLRGLQKGDALS